jgi:hypothetical protein
MEFQRKSGVTILYSASHVALERVREALEQFISFGRRRSHDLVMP